MAKPIIKKIAPFDAQTGTTVTFSYTGTTPVKNSIRIFSGATMALVYEGEQSSFSSDNHLLFDIPSDTDLENGKYFCAQIMCTDLKGNTSSWSDASYFYCFSAPTFEISNLSSESTNTLKMSDLTLELNYSQNEGEELLRYKFYLYSSVDVLIAASDDIYTGEMTYTFRGLDNLTTYHVLCMGETQNGMEISTATYEIYVNQSNPSTFMMIETTADNAGVVNYSTNIVLLESERDESTYIYDDGKINLTDDSLVYRQGFEILDEGQGLEYTFVFKLKNGIFKDLVKWANYTDDETYIDEAVISCVDCGDDEYCRYKLTVSNLGLDYVIYSDPVSIVAEFATVWIQYNSGLFDIYVFTEN